jgi:hypothetical protein
VKLIKFVCWAEASPKQRRKQIYLAHDGEEMGCTVRGTASGAEYFAVSKGINTA